MATASAPGVVGPVPFTDVCGARAAVPLSNEPDDDDASVATAAALPSGVRRRLRWYQGTWVAPACVPGLIAIRQGSFAPRRGDVVLASPHKCGTTWLKALAFATMARGAYPPAGAGHPLLRLNPHDCVPFMEMLFADGLAGSRKMAMLPSPRLMATHMHHAILPTSISNNPDCKIVYVCRNPKDMLVSLWHFTRGVQPDLAFSDVFEHACEGVSFSGPIYLGPCPGVLERQQGEPGDGAVPEIRGDPARPRRQREEARAVRRAAALAGRGGGRGRRGHRAALQLRDAEGLEVNRAAGSGSLRYPNISYFRRGQAGDWANHMTPEMAGRLDAVMEEKLRGSGLSFA